jgi:hypothetical protein
MNFVLTREVLHPETYETLHHVGDILTLQDIQTLSVDLGIDEIKCHVCSTLDATIATAMEYQTT